MAKTPCKANDLDSHDWREIYAGELDQHLPEFKGPVKIEKFICGFCGIAEKTQYYPYVGYSYRPTPADPIENCIE